EVTGLLGHQLQVLQHLAGPSPGQQCTAQPCQQHAQVVPALLVGTLMRHDHGKVGLAAGVVHALTHVDAGIPPAQGKHQRCRRIDCLEVTPWLAEEVELTAQLAGTPYVQQQAHRKTQQRQRPHDKTHPRQHHRINERHMALTILVAVRVDQQGLGGWQEQKGSTDQAYQERRHPVVQQQNAAETRVQRIECTTGQWIEKSKDDAENQPQRQPDGGKRADGVDHRSPPSSPFFRAISASSSLRERSSRSAATLTKLLRIVSSLPSCNRWMTSLISLPSRLERDTLAE